MKHSTKKKIGLEEVPPTVTSDKKYIEEIQTLVKSTGFDELIGYKEGEK